VVHAVDQPRAAARDRREYGIDAEPRSRTVPVRRRRRVAMGQLFDFILAGVGMDEIGSASGVLQAVQQLSSAVGVAALGTIFFSAFAGHPPTHALAITAWACLVPVAATFGPAPGAARTVPRPRSRPVHGAAGDRQVTVSEGHPCTTPGPRRARLGVRRCCCAWGPTWICGKSSARCSLIHHGSTSGRRHIRCRRQPPSR